MNNIKEVCIQTIHSMLLYIPLVQKLHQAVCNIERTTSAECRDVKMLSNYESGIIWFNTEQYYIEKMFIRAQQRRSDEIRIINYFPPQLWSQKEC